MYRRKQTESHDEMNDRSWDKDEWLADDEFEDDGSDDSDEDPDFSEPFEPTYLIPRDILVNRRIERLVYTDFTYGVPQDILTELTAQLTPRERELAFPFLEKVPMGILIMLGPAGSEKSWKLGFILLLMIAGG